MEKIHISRELLHKMYVDEGKTLKQIGLELGVSRQTIANKLKDYSIPIRPNAMKPKSTRVKVSKPKPEKPYTNKETFQQVYSDLKSLNLVAKFFGISLDTAHLWKTRLNIKTIHYDSNEGYKKRLEGKPYTDRETLQKYYDQYSIYDLATMWNCNPTTISKWLKKLDIPVKTLSEQWARKAKNGSIVVKGDKFDLQEFKRVYTNSEYISKRVINYIKDTVGECQCCGVSDVLDLHHINENPKDNRPENHVILCPNCHARVHRLGKSVDELCPNYISWDKLIEGYAEAK